MNSTPTASVRQPSSIASSGSSTPSWRSTTTYTWHTAGQSSASQPDRLDQLERGLATPLSSSSTLYERTPLLAAPRANSPTPPPATNNRGIQEAWHGAALGGQLLGWAGAASLLGFCLYESVLLYHGDRCLINPNGEPHPLLGAAAGVAALIVAPAIGYRIGQIAGRPAGALIGCLICC